MKDLRIEIRIKNNMVWQAIREKHGDISIAEFCRRENINQYQILNFLNFKIDPIICRKKVMPEDLEVDGAEGVFYWRRSALKLSAILGKDPEFLFPEHLRAARKSFYAIEIDGQKAFAESIERPKIPEEIISNQELSTALSTVLKQKLETLTPREEKVLKMRFGIDGDGEEKSLEEIAQNFDVTKERIRQIEAKALRKLRHPSISHELRPFVGGLN